MSSEEFRLEGIAGEHQDRSDEAILISEVTDDALERACFPCGGGVPTIFGTYCFTCPAGEVET
jgi:hypothetical protein